MPDRPLALRRPALVVIDVQKGFDDADFWGQRNNPECETNIAALLARWRRQGWPVVLVRHDSSNPGSPLTPGSPGHEFQEIAEGPADLMVTKSVNSAFLGKPDLDVWLRGNDLSEVVICGITTNHCCETTARMAGNLGYETVFVIDATYTFGRVSPNGTEISADLLSEVTATNLHGEFATVVRTADLLGGGVAPHPR